MNESVGDISFCRLWRSGMHSSISGARRAASYIRRVNQAEVCCGVAVACQVITPSFVCSGCSAGEYGGILLQRQRLRGGIPGPDQRGVTGQGQTVLQEAEVGSVCYHPPSFNHG